MLLKNACAGRMVHWWGSHFGRDQRKNQKHQNGSRKDIKYDKTIRKMNTINNTHDFVSYVAPSVSMSPNKRVSKRREENRRWAAFKTCLTMANAVAKRQKKRR